MGCCQSELKLKHRKAREPAVMTEEKYIRDIENTLISGEFSQFFKQNQQLTLKSIEDTLCNNHNDSNFLQVFEASGSTGSLSLLIAHILINDSPLDSKIKTLFDSLSENSKISAQKIAMLLGTSCIISCEILPFCCAPELGPSPYQLQHYLASLSSARDSAKDVLLNSFPATTHGLTYTEFATSITSSEKLAKSLSSAGLRELLWEEFSQPNRLPETKKQLSSDFSSKPTLGIQRTDHQLDNGCFELSRQKTCVRGKKKSRLDILPKEKPKPRQRKVNSNVSPYLTLQERVGDAIQTIQFRPSENLSKLAHTFALKNGLSYRQKTAVLHKLQSLVTNSK